MKDDPAMTPTTSSYHAVLRAKDDGEIFTTDFQAVSLEAAREWAQALARTYNGWDIVSLTEDQPQLSPSTPAVAEENPRDFSASGLGIGGLRAYEEPPVVPSERQAAQMERQRMTEVVCRRCGASSLDGAMFTTFGGEDLCDDCV
jgi:hypothetical protein